MASKNLLEYVWNTQILPQAGYSFSRLHTAGYSLIALQNMNLAHFFPQVYWNTACLSINAGANEESENNKETKYGKIAAAIGQMQQRGIKVNLPDINKAGFGFTPNTENNSIIFGLKGINRIGDEVVRLIIDNRPYQSFEDFLRRMYDTKMIQNSQITQLIKAGCFDSFENREAIMKKFAKHVFEPKKKLTTANLNMMIVLDVIPKEFELEIRFYKFRKWIKRKVFKNLKNPKDRLFLLDDISVSFMYEHFSEECIVDFHINQPIVSERVFEREYEKKIMHLKEWLGNEDTLHMVNEKLFNIEWKEMSQGNLSKWEMDSVSFYYSKHELANVNRQKYDIANFNELSTEPEIVKEYESRGRKRQEFRLYRIAGTVLDRDKNKHTVTILTTDGVVTVKFYSGLFSHYNKQISKRENDGKKTIIEGSWFTRGNKLILSGFRRGNQFIPRKYRNSIYQHTVALIEGIDEDGNLSLVTERAKA